MYFLTIHAYSEKFKIKYITFFKIKMVFNIIIFVNYYLIM